MFVRKGAGSSENAKIGGAGWLAMAGREGGSAVLSSSFGEKAAVGTSNVEHSTLSIEGGRAWAGRSLFTSFGWNSCSGGSVWENWLNFHNGGPRGTTHIVGGLERIRNVGFDEALRRRDGSAARGRNSVRSFFTSFGWNLEAECRNVSPGCSRRFAQKPRFGLEGTKRLEGIKIRIPIFLPSNFFVIRQGRCAALRRRDGSVPRGRNSGRRVFTSFGWNLEAEYRKPSPGCSFCQKSGVTVGCDFPVVAFVFCR